MDLLAKSDEEIFAIAKPFWENLVKASNMKDYGGFTRDFSTQMLFGANEVELGKQWANNKIITNLNESSEMQFPIQLQLEVYFLTIGQKRRPHSNLRGKQVR